MISRTVALGTLLYLSYNCAASRSWKYEILNFTATSSDENLANVSMQADRVSFSESAISGTVDFKFHADETTMVEFKMYYSVSGREEDYYETVYKIPRQNFPNFIDNYYDGFVYPNFADCSNLPKFEGKFVPPFPKKTYIFQKCMLTADNLPHVLPSGYYKMVVKLMGPVEMVFVCTSKNLSQKRSSKGNTNPNPQFSVKDIKEQTFLYSQQ